MEESRNGSDTDNRGTEARELIERVNIYMENMENRGIVFQRFEGSAVRSGTGGLSHEEAACRENEGAVQQHLISSVVFRCIETKRRDKWELEDVWDNVDIRQLDDIGRKPDYECRPVNYSGQNNIQVAMAENANIVLVRTIIDWGRLDGNVWSQQIVWSGSFADSHRVLQLLEDNSNSANLIELRMECFDFHPHLREQCIARHGSHPLAAAMAAVDSSVDLVATGDGHGEGDSLICAICHDMVSIGQDAKLLPCNHPFHAKCIFKWFCVKLECPVCRRNGFQ